MKDRIWIRRDLPDWQKFVLGALCIAVILGLWLSVTTPDGDGNRVISRNVLPNPLEVVGAFPVLTLGTTTPGEFDWEKSLFYAAGISLSREGMAFLVVLVLALPLGIFMSASGKVRSFVYPLLVVGTFIPIAAIIPLTQAFFGIGELQKIIFLALGMFFVLLGLVVKEMDEVDGIYLQTAYTLGFSQLKTVFLVMVPTAMSRIWKHLSAVFGLGWGYIIFAEMVNSSGGNSVSGIGWLFLARQRRNLTPDMYAIFFVIIAFAFLFSLLFRLTGKKLFPHEAD